jgi:hypothetical protein
MNEPHTYTSTASDDECWFAADDVLTINLSAEDWTGEERKIIGGVEIFYSREICWLQRNSMEIVRTGFGAGHRKRKNTFRFHGYYVVLILQDAFHHQETL